MGSPAGLAIRSAPGLSRSTLRSRFPDSGAHAHGRIQRTSPDVAEEGLAHIERTDCPDASDPTLMSLARFAREEDERIRGTLNALWKTRPRAVEAELFR